MKKVTRKDYRVSSRLIHGPELMTKQWDFSHHVVPPQSSSVTYAVSSAQRGALGFIQFASETELNQEPILIYDRLEEPNRNMLEERLALAEGGDMAVAFTTGMAAISAVLGVLTRAGEHIIAHHTLYGCTYSLLANWFPRDGKNVTFTNLLDIEKVMREIKKETRVIYLETPSNPTLEIIDLGELRKAVDKVNSKRKKEEKIKIVVDNTFATPFCQRPISLGADISLASLTKGIGGFGTDMGGIVVGPKELRTALLMYRKDFGGVLAPKSAWPTLVYGLPTLDIRMRKQQATAAQVAEFLENHPKIARVSYPGLKSHPQYKIARKQLIDCDGNFAPGSMLYFVLKGKPAAASKSGSVIIDHLAEKSLVITLAVSLGMIKTLIEHPSSMTHAAIPINEQEKFGIDPGGIRLSIGIEDACDIICDLENALKLIK
ncbi:MAG TPA: aminotransferase class I/II-fold pyridoxal phosphate-dependent enzyme [Candidatus Wallbacteria bacterium]|nr:aminotransferase class I/II-fold pyridoxal phosphate-dependent enzyme [Candidatus Wallbacteria bacterium]